MRFLVLTFLLFFVGCSDRLPDTQCDPERRCTADDTPVCGTDGQWYECGLVADCEQVAVSFDEDACDGEPPDTCPDIACAPCASGDPIETYDGAGCLTSCDCPAVSCPAIDFDCETEPGPDGCPQCVGCDVPSCEADGCQLVTPRGADCPICSCEPICAPLEQCDGGCEVGQDDSGCDVCLCDEPTCDRLFCDNFCQHGYVFDDTGCPTCECFEPCDGRPECDLACPTGNAVDPATGCADSCDCRAESCPDVGCRLFCEHGFRENARGCEECECRGAPCGMSEACATDEVCIGGDFIAGECVKLTTCDPLNGACENGRPCGFYFRTDCCPPLTSCSGLPSCPAVCLLGFGDLPEDVTF